MSKEIIWFSNIEIERHKFYHRKNLVLLEDVDIDNRLLSSMVPSGEENHRYFTGFKDNDYKIKPLLIMLPKTNAYVRRCDGETKWMNFLIKDMNCLKNVIIFEAKSVKVLKKNLIANPSTIINF